ncbi:hypothetical protein [Burkholderia pyrrocinia]|uniref:hypothetical protein n=1 Tax=Burkholderia pyrrocinia TaxID=60550 RepID=UPI0011E4DA92|nr:hypothetical protein [Burkholderia pyrrocinia]
MTTRLRSVVFIGWVEVGQSAVAEVDRLAAQDSRPNRRKAGVSRTSHHSETNTDALGKVRPGLCAFASQADTLAGIAREERSAMPRKTEQQDDHKEIFN